MMRSAGILWVRQVPERFSRAQELFSTAGLADDERYDFVRVLELLEDGRFQVGEFHDDRLTCRLLVSDIVKPYASILTYMNFSIRQKTYGIDGSEN